MDQELTARLARAAEEVFSSAPVFLAYAYGSRVSGSARQGSDLDVGYYLHDFRPSPPLAIREEMLLATRLSESVGCEVDLRNLGEAPLELRGRVLTEGVRIYCADDVARVNLERDLLGRYHDYKEAFRRMHEMRLRRFAERGLRTDGGQAEVRPDAE